METYSAPSTELATNTSSPETAPVPLFDGWDEEGFKQELPRQDASAEIIRGKIGRRALAGQERGAPRYPRERPIQDVIAELKQSREREDRDDPYGDLGGGLRTSLRNEYGRRYGFIDPIEAYQDWHTETQQAVEQLRLYDMTTADIAAMTKHDRRIFSLHAFSFDESLKSTAHLIDVYQGEVLSGSPLERRFGRLRTPSELISYRKTLLQLHGAIGQSDVMTAVRQELSIPSPKQHWYYEARSKVLHKACADKQKRGDVIAVYERDKFRVERVRSESGYLSTQE